MEKKVKSLEEIFYEDHSGLPVKVLQRIPCGDRADTFCLLGIESGTDTAFGYYEKRPKSLIRRTASKKQWYIWTPEKVPHWPAIVEKKHATDHSVYELTTYLFRNATDAEVSLQRTFVRLATEYPPIMIEGPE